MSAKTLRSAMAGALFLSSPAAGRDLQDLGQLLIPAYTVMNFAAICAADPGWADTQPSGQKGIAIHYAEHIKNDIVAHLDYDEALTVLRVAANRARGEALAQLWLYVYSSEPAAEAVKLHAWCAGYAADVIAAFIKNDDQTHQEVHARIQRAVSGATRP